MAAIHLQIIQGMTAPVLWRVLKAHGFRVSPRYWLRLAHLAGCGAMNSFYRSIEQAANRLLILRHEFAQPPLFILGHWRSGTTLLHNLLAQDPLLTAPTYYQCTFPHHFVFSQPIGIKVAERLSPSTRPMDNMAMAMDLPQEDEFALASLSGVSPYLAVLFPQTPAESLASLDLDQLAPAQRRNWERALAYFLKALACRKGTGLRALLKSPTHTARVKALLRLLPGAKFVHIVRDPYAVFLSARRLWERGLVFSHLQTTDPAMIDEYILSGYEEMHRLYQRDRSLVPPGSLHEIRFEDLTADPQSCVAGIYEALGLEGFEQMAPSLRAYLATLHGYRKNPLALTPGDQALVASRWSMAFETWGYPIDPPPDADYL